MSQDNECARLELNRDRLCRDANDGDTLQEELSALFEEAGAMPHLTELDVRDDIVLRIVEDIGEYGPRRFRLVIERR